VEIEEEAENHPSQLHISLIMLKQSQKLQKDK